MFDDLALLDAFVARQEQRKRGYCPHAPHPKQAEFLALDCKNAFYGGAAGGGKSDALLMGALQYVTVPGYSALILRRSFADLNKADAVMTRAHEWLGSTDATWNGDEHKWTFPNGATIEFGFFDNERHKDKYQGGAWQYIAIDELTQWPNGWARYLFSRLRKPSKGALASVPLRFRGAGNPGGIGHEWVKAKYIDEQTADAPFVQALLEDNPSLDAASYEDALRELDQTTFDQLRHGKWVRSAHGLVYHFNETSNIGPLPNDIRYPWSHVLSLDFGVSNATSFNVLAYRDTDPNVYVRRSYKRVGMITDDVVDEYKTLDGLFHFNKVIGDIGGLGKLFVEEMRRRFSIPVEAAQKANKLGYIMLLNSSLEKSRVIVTDKEACKDLISEWKTLPWEDETQQAEMPGFENHCTDGTLYGWRAYPNFHERQPDPKPTYDEIVKKTYEHHPKEEDGYEPKQFWEETGGTRWQNGGSW